MKPAIGLMVLVCVMFLFCVVGALMVKGVGLRMFYGVLAGVNFGSACVAYHIIQMKKDKRWRK